MTFTLGDPEFLSTSQLRAYCENGRILVRPLANELRIASEELQGALKEVPGQSPWMLGADSKVRARIVSAHLKHAADGVDAAVVGLVRTFLSFEKHFLHPAGGSTRKRTFTIEG